MLRQSSTLLPDVMELVIILVTIRAREVVRMAARDHVKVVVMVHVQYRVTQVVKVAVKQHVIILAIKVVNNLATLVTLV